MPSQPSNAGIVTEEGSGSRVIPESTRADGSTRKAIKIRPGYRPPEDVEVYKNRTAEAFRERGKRIGIPGAVGAQEDKSTSADADQSGSAASNKNAKRREARKKAKAAEGSEGTEDKTIPAVTETKAEEVDPEAEKEKKARNLKKKLKQAKDLQSKKEEGGTLLPEQIAKVIKINELVRELEALGFDSDGAPKNGDGKPEAGETAEG